MPKTEDSLSEQIVEIEWVGGEGGMPEFLRGRPAKQIVRTMAQHHRYRVINIDKGLVLLEHDANTCAHSSGAIGAVWVPLSRIAAIKLK